MIGQRQQPLEHLGIGHVAVEHGRNAARCAPARNSAAAPSTQRGSASTADALRNFSSGSQSAASGKAAAEIHDLPLAGLSTITPETDERPSANSLKFSTSMPSAESAERISWPAASSPARPQNARYRRDAQPQRPHLQPCRRRASHSRQLLIFSLSPAKQPIDTPDLVERRQAEADDADAPRSRRKVAQVSAVPRQSAVPAHRNTCPLAARTNGSCPAADEG